LKLRLLICNPKSYGSKNITCKGSISNGTTPRTKEDPYLPQVCSYECKSEAEWQRLTTGISKQIANQNSFHAYAHFVDPLLPPGPAGRVLCEAGGEYAPPATVEVAVAETPAEPEGEAVEIVSTSQDGQEVKSSGSYPIDDLSLSGNVLHAIQRQEEAGGMCEKTLLSPQGQIPLTKQKAAPEVEKLVSGGQNETRVQQMRGVASSDIGLPSPRPQIQGAQHWGNGAIEGENRSGEGNSKMRSFVQQLPQDSALGVSINQDGVGSNPVPATIQEPATEEQTETTPEPIAEPEPETAPVEPEEKPLYAAAWDILDAPMRLKDLAAALEVDADKLKASLQDPESTVVLAHAGWVKRREPKD
jgi:hypothetical protein